MQRRVKNMQEGLPPLTPASAPKMGFRAFCPLIPVPRWPRPSQLSGNSSPSSGLPPKSLSNKFVQNLEGPGLAGCPWHLGERMTGWGCLSPGSLAVCAHVVGLVFALVLGTAPENTMWVDSPWEKGDGEVLGEGTLQNAKDQGQGS